jgi:hypothetical protein
MNAVTLVFMALNPDCPETLKPFVWEQRYQAAMLQY